MTAPTILWLRRELRVDDLPALHAAIERGGPVVPVFIWRPEEEHGGWAPGGASRWWLHHSLMALSDRFTALGAPLIIRRGPVVATLQHLMTKTGARHVCFTRRVEPAERALESTVCDALSASGHGGDTLWPPDMIRTKTNRPYRVFTPFSRACLAAPDPGAPIAAPVALRGSPAQVASVPIDELGLLPDVSWDAGLGATWRPGESEARTKLHDWVAGQRVADYGDGRDRPAIPGTARLSPHLAFGELSVRRAWHHVQARIAIDGDAAPGAMAWRRQLLWREFGRQLMWHHPHTPGSPLDRRFERIPWRDDARFLARWQRGETGFPMVDAAMNELWTTGWMHNRARMVVASFLVKDGLIDWREGARWFWDTLVDADLSNNTLGWQWAAGCGADAAPFFRIFNPVSQSRRHDPTGAYLTRWLPELTGRTGHTLHEPWRDPPAGWPERVVEHRVVRERALTLWRETIRGR